MLARQAQDRSQGWHGLRWHVSSGFHVDAAEEIASQTLASAGPDAAMVMMQASEADADIRAAAEEASRTGSARFLAYHNCL
jgi:hypothetical protein